MTEVTPKLEHSLGGTIEKNIPEDVEWIDDAFILRRPGFGLYHISFIQTYGTTHYRGATYEGVLTMSRWHLKCLQDGTLQDYTRVVNST